MIHQELKEVAQSLDHYVNAVSRLSQAIEQNGIPVDSEASMKRLLMPLQFFTDTIMPRFSVLLNGETQKWYVLSRRLGTRIRTLQGNEGSQKRRTATAGPTVYKTQTLYKATHVVSPSTIVVRSSIIEIPPWLHPMVKIGRRG